MAGNVVIVMMVAFLCSISYRTNVENFRNDYIANDKKNYKYCCFRVFVLSTSGVLPVHHGPAHSLEVNLCPE